MNKTDKHRKIYPLPFDQICTLSSFEQILGCRPDDYTPEERKRRWEKAMSFDESGEVKAEYEYTGDCEPCRQMDNGWCNHMGLPCGVNPVLTFRMGMPGLACMGMGTIGEDEESE